MNWYLLSSSDCDGLVQNELFAMADGESRALWHNLTRNARNLGLLDSFFVEFAEVFTWVKPKACTIAFPRLKGEIGALAFCQEVVIQTSIMLLPATVYDYSDQHVRLGFGSENMPKALERLATISGDNRAAG
jgi:hypothetical protein